jgi:peptide-methionine (S)-S-oxide reductase
MEKATFAAGCFWGVEAAFQGLKGIIATSVGYAGGTVSDPTFEDVCLDLTGHAEAVEVLYDPSKISYDDLLEIFWNSHDPTTPNRQGSDIGSQYRSAIFYHSASQNEAAQTSKALLQQNEKFRNRPIVTQIEKATIFYKAEEYHQQYLEKRGVTACMVLEF